MNSFLFYLLPSAEDNIDAETRKNIANIIAISMVIASLVVAPILFVLGRTPRSILLVSNVVVFSIVIALIRFKFISLGSFLLILYLYLSLLVPTITEGRNVQMNQFLIAVPLFACGLIFHSSIIFFSLAINIALICLLGSAFNYQEPDFMWQNVVFAIVFNISIAIFIYLGAKTTKRYLDEIDRSQQQLESYSKTLELEQARLDARVQEHTSELTKALAIAEQQIKEQQLLLQRNEIYQKTIRDLSVPTIPVNADSIIIPLVGNLDEYRLSAFQEQTLNAIEQYRAKHVILDITGVSVIDSYVAEGIVRVVVATHLLGAQVMVVGVRPEVAQTIVQLQLPLTSLQTFSSLKAAVHELMHCNKTAPSLVA